MTMKKAKIAVLVSGGGTNLTGTAGRAGGGTAAPAERSRWWSPPTEDAYALTRAANAGVPADDGLPQALRRSGGL